jgi:hypothetical protein
MRLAAKKESEVAWTLATQRTLLQARLGEAEEEPEVVSTPVESSCGKVGKTDLQAVPKAEWLDKHAYDDG